MLAPADLARLAVEHRRASAAWSASPRAAEVRRRLDRAARAMSTAAGALAELERHDLALLGRQRAEVNELHDRLDGFAGSASHAVAGLDARGAGRGGARRLPGVLGALPPRAALLVRLRQLDPAASNAEVLDAAAEILALCGESDAGLDRVLDRLPQNRRKSPPVLAYPAPQETATFAA